MLKTILNYIKPKPRYLYDACPRCGGRGETGRFVTDPYTGTQEWDGAECLPCDGTGNEMFPFLSESDKAELAENFDRHFAEYKKRQGV